MQHLPTSSDPNLLVGPELFSDAGVYRIDEGTAIVQSVDFFPPLVDDPAEFGRIAAANALSDLYATGARPLTALNVVGFPDKELPVEVLNEILRGGAEQVHAAGAVVVGGHSVRDSEVKYGLCVTGVVDPARMMTNQGARPGDALILTKALGTGFVTTANRAGACDEDVLAAACRSMTTLNAAAADAALAAGVRGATDVSGFGLAGHASELARASGVTVHVETGRLPLLAGALPFVEAGHFTRANATTRTHLEPTTRISADADPARVEFLFDPQTSGGLLLSIAPDHADALVDRCRDAGLESTAVIGSVREQQAGVDLTVTAERVCFLILHVRPWLPAP